MTIHDILNKTASNALVRLVEVIEDTSFKNGVRETHTKQADVLTIYSRFSNILTAETKWLHISVGSDEVTNKPLIIITYEK